VKFCIAANEDGFGPSAFAWHLVRAVRAARPGAEVVLLNRGAHEFNSRLYEQWPEVRLEPVDSLIRFEKAHGEVHVPRTINALCRYQRRREAYARAVRPHLRGCRAAIDIGVPLLARAAREAGIRAVTVFDHSWARTLRGISSQDARYERAPAPTEEDREFAELFAAQVEEDERCASEVWLFEPFLTPPEFSEHWRRLGFAPRMLPGALGGGLGAAEARRALDRLLAELGQEPAGEQRPLVLLSPGGTPVWDSMIPALIGRFVEGPEREYLPVLSHPNVDGAWRERMRAASRKIRWFDLVRGATQQAILPAFALVVGRAGGGTVNDCLATRTPLAFVEEHQWQVGLIERECRRWQPPPRSASWPEFRADPDGCIDRMFAARRPPPDVPHGAERAVVESLLGG
jgi:hypothetical protein